jgi:DNA-directed RNA polymerase specialized sigma subunit
MNQKLKQWQIDKYQDIYKMAWDRQNKIDRKENPKIMPSPQAKNGQDAGKFGKMGGAPKLALSENAKIINKMLMKDMKVSEIADILGKSHQAVTQIKNRYSLPRK